MNYRLNEFNISKRKASKTVLETVDDEKRNEQEKKQHNIY